MENNTITPTPQPQPQPAGPMPTFGANINNAAPAPAPAPATSAMPDMAPAQPAPTATPAPEPATPAPEPTPEPLPEPTVTAVPAPEPAPAPAPEPENPVATAIAEALANDPAPETPTPAPAPIVAEPTPAETPAEAPVTTPATTATPEPTSAEPVPAPEAAPAVQTAPATPAEPTPDTPVVPAPEVNLSTKKRPISKGRLAALILILLIVIAAGVLAAVLILNVNKKDDPVSIAKEATKSLTEPATAPTSITGGLDLMDGDKSLVTASFVLESDHVYLSYSGLSAVLGSYLGLVDLEDLASLSSLAAITSLIEIAEDEWWQIPLEDVDFGSAYRAHPFLTIAEATTAGYRVAIDPDILKEFLEAATGETIPTDDPADCISAATNCIDDGSGTNCAPATDCATPAFSYLPGVGDVSIDDLPTFRAEINADHRFTALSFEATKDAPVEGRFNLFYDKSSHAPAEYRPIEDLAADFLQAIGY